MTSKEYLPCPICLDGKEKPRFREEGLRYHLREFHKRVDVDELVKLAREIASEEGHSSKSKLTRDDVRVEVWEERDRLHIGIQNNGTGDYLVSWWDDDAREMFEHGFFKSGPGLKESVLEYAEDMGILEK